MFNKAFRWRGWNAQHRKKVVRSRMAWKKHYMLAFWINQNNSEIS